MTLYNVHLYREMRLVFAGIDAGSHEEAAAKARDLATADADEIDDCDGETFAALVDVAGDEQYEHSRCIDFEPGRLLKAATAQLEALREVTPLLDACARNAERLGQREFAALLLTVMSADRAALAQTTATPRSNGPMQPAMTPPTKNDCRAMRVDHILTWCKDWSTSREGLIDLLTDARHWCDRKGECFGDLDRMAYRHYLEEGHASEGSRP